ncbi:alpha/beta hydrolase [Nocardioides cavernaquae]|uniref:DUF1023 domain-containing protein n=1 Tax=Nocardioides cavernaquae TaxID=2321396 RepID=A0A3A5H675_9ACTN|nr:alpha/beta hydrolase [Nocardioides cavernaquae]RJS45368.1 hypothetical protein D4739_03470 [Nocardioides cavernaquae]
MGTFVGMDPAAIRRLASLLGGSADQLDSISVTIQRLVSDAVSQWEGPECQDFVASWEGEHRLGLQQAGASVRLLSVTAETNAEDQDRTSSEGGFFAGVVDAVKDAAAAAAVAAATAAARSDVIVPTIADLPASGPPRAGSPGQNATWWNELSDAEKAAVLKFHPEWVGNLDGVPGSVRDQANRALLPQYRDELEQQLADARARGDDDQAEIIQNKLDGLDSVEEVLALGDRQLLTLDISGEEQLKAAVAIGNVDTADHIAVFTPGLTTTVEDSLKGYDKDMLELRATMDGELDLAGRDESTAVVSWLGYEAPQLNTDVLDPGFDGSSASVANDDLARAGGDDLAGFYNGLDAMRRDDAHITALGHSYGSTTLGFALQQGTGVDDAVFFGSPGLGTDNLADLGLSEGHAFNMEASSDEVGDAGQFGADPDNIPGIDRLSTSSSEVDGVELSESEWHSEYLMDQSTPQHNMAVVAVGADHDRLVQTNELDLGLPGSLANHAVEAGRDGAVWAGDKVEDGGRWVGDKISDGWNKVTGG